MKTIMLWCALLFALYGECYAGFARLSWDPPSTSMDGTTLDQNTLGYKVYYGIAPGVYTAIVDVGSGTLVYDEPCITYFSGCITRSYMVYGLAPGITYYFVATAYDSSGNESDYSNEVQKTTLVDAILPGDATLFTATPYGTGVRLSWTNPPDQDLVRVILEYSFSGGTFINLVMLKAVPGKAQTYDHLNLAPGTYSYAIHTRDSSGNTTHTAYAKTTIGETSQPTTPGTTNTDIPQPTTTETTTGDTPQPTTPPSSDKKDGSEGCFIATAAYGSYLDPHVVTLRKFRDEYLLTNAPGKVFVAMYYSVSPPIADFTSQHNTAKAIVRIGLIPILSAIAYPKSAMLLFAMLLWTIFGLHQRKQ